MPRLALLPLFASLASAAVVGDYDPMPTSPACDKFCGAWTCASRYGRFYCHELESFGCDCSGCCVTAQPPSSPPGAPPPPPASPPPTPPALPPASPPSPLPRLLGRPVQNRPVFLLFAVLNVQWLPLHELRIRERVDALAAHAALDFGERREHRLMVSCVHHPVSSPGAGEAMLARSRPPRDRASRRSRTRRARARARRKKRLPARRALSAAQPMTDGCANQCTAHALSH